MHKKPFIPTGFTLHQPPDLAATYHKVSIVGIVME
jgi:hypothetical protein